MILIWLAVAQGVAEFLPLSSTAHLIVISKFVGSVHPGIHYIVVLHLGSMFAIFLYFWQEIKGMILGIPLLFKGRVAPSVWLALMVVLATLPVIFAGVVVAKLMSPASNSVVIIGINSIIFGFLLYIADKVDIKKKDIHEITWKHALWVGVAQVFALLPGASRSGCTISMARFLGYSRIESTKFSFLMGIPTILGASVLKLKDISLGDPSIDFDFFFFGCLLSFIVSYAVISILMRLLNHISFLPFAIYRCLLGVVLLIWFT